MGKEYDLWSKTRPEIESELFGDNEGITVEKLHTFIDRIATATHQTIGRLENRIADLEAKLGIETKKLDD